MFLCVFKGVNNSRLRLCSSILCNPVYHIISLISWTLHECLCSVIFLAKKSRVLFFLGVFFRARYFNVFVLFFFCAVCSSVYVCSVLVFWCVEKEKQRKNLNKEILRQIRIVFVFHGNHRSFFFSSFIISIRKK